LVNDERVLVRRKIVSSLDLTALAARMEGVMYGFAMCGKKEMDLRGACLSISEDKVEQKTVK
jgi:hypothetical protein